MHEVEILKKLNGHPCIVGFKDVFETPSMLVIVMELANGGELFDYVLDDYETNSFNEKVTKVQFYQVSSSLRFT